MYNFYEQDKEKKAITQKQKTIFKFLNDYCEKNSISFEEIYLDNTYGNIDKRKKLYH